MIAVVPGVSVGAHVESRISVVRDFKNSIVLMMATQRFDGILGETEDDYVLRGRLQMVKMYSSPRKSVFSNISASQGLGLD